VFTFRRGGKGVRRTFWNCDRCKAEFEYSAEWGEQPINYLAFGGPPRKVDLCVSCSAELDRFMAGAELEREPPQIVGVVGGESVAPPNVPSIFDDDEEPVSSH
jgi:hypothetical protein